MTLETTVRAHPSRGYHPSLYTGNLWDVHSIPLSKGKGVAKSLKWTLTNIIILFVKLIVFHYTRVLWFTKSLKRFNQRTCW